MSSDIQISPPIVVVMGVSGVGKSTLGTALAQRIGCAFADGDSFHAPRSIEKMRAGVPLEDADRQSWLRAIAAQIAAWRAAGEGGVIACSALKRAYRDIIFSRVRGDGADGARLVYLKGSRALIEERLRRRRDHFMPASLLDSQLATLEEPAAAERPIVLDAAQPAAELAAETLRSLGWPPASGKPGRV